MKKDCFHNIIIKIIDVSELIPLFQVKCSAHRSQLVCFLEQPQNEPWSWSSRNQLWCCEVNANHFRFAVCHEPREKEKKNHKYYLFQINLSQYHPPEGLFNLLPFSAADCAMVQLLL